jgi:hypothetical protein
MIVQVLLAAILLLLAWWLLTDSDRAPEGEAGGSEVGGNPVEAATLRPGVPVARPAPEQTQPRPGEDYPARVG